MERAALIAAVRRAVAADVAAMQRMLAASRDEATGDESRAENKYDTRALEASYLAAGQGQRLLELQQLAAWADQLAPAPPSRVCLGAAVQVDDRGRRRWLLLAPAGGPVIQVGSARVALVSVAAPLGRALLGLEPGDCGALDERQVEVLAVG